jgi:ABC-type oligopeptide transport system substrate-binding subunit
LLRFPLLNPASPSGSSSAADGAPAGEILTRRFQAVRRNENQFLYRRQISEPDGVPQYHVAEIVESKFESPEQLLQALFRGEVDVLPQVLPWHLDLLRKDEQLFVGKYGLPTTHVLQFNPRSEPLANRQLRGALTIGLNRPRILRESVLRSESIRDARLVSTAWPRSSYAYNTLVKPREYDLTLGFTLAVAARKPLGGAIPPLKMVCPPDPVILDAARDIIRQWALLDITVELIPQTADTNISIDSDQWDILYRPVRMREPLTELWPFLALDDRARVESLSHLPDWLRQELVELDYAGDWKSAIAALRDLHRQLWQEMLFIPLWELDEFYVLRKTIARPPMLNAELGPLHIYQGVEEWIVR